MNIKYMRTYLTFALFILLFFNIENANAKTCLFCKPEVIEDGTVLIGKYFNVVLDLEPRVYGHLLIVPKRHIVKAHELTKEEWEEFSIILPKIVNVFSEFLYTNQYIILEKNGPKAFQHIPHVHFHVFPVTSQKWADIFDIVPERLSPENYEEEIALFRSYFSS